MSNPLAVFGKIPRPAIFIIALTLLIIPLFVPLGLPVGVTPFMQTMWDAVDGADVILFNIGMSPGFWAEMSLQVYAVIQHCMAVPDLKLIIAPHGATASALIQNILDGIGLGDPIANPLNKVEGTDWVFMAMIPPPTEVAFTGMTEDLLAVLTEDQDGTLAADLPIFDNIDAVDDIDVFLWQTGPRNSPDVATYVYPAYPSEVSGNPTYFVCGIGEGYAHVSPWIGPGQPYPAGMFGPVNAAEYMQLSFAAYDLPLQPIGLKVVDSLSLFHILAIVLMIFGNLVIVGEKLGGKK